MCKTTEEPSLGDETHDFEQLSGLETSNQPGNPVQEENISCFDDILMIMGSNPFVLGENMCKTTEEPLSLDACAVEPTHTSAHLFQISLNGQLAKKCYVMLASENMCRFIYYYNK